MAVLTYRELCSGYGGLGLAVEQVTGATLIDHAEITPSAATVHAAHWPDVPNLGDITTIDWAALEPTDILCAGFPCQPVSQAGKKKVTTDVRWLWPHIAEAVRVLRPGHVVLENVTGLLVPWRDGRAWRGAPVEEVVGDLAALGYVGSWRSVRASDVGAPHRRQRVFIVAADAHRIGGNGTGSGGTRRRTQPAHRGGAPADPVRTRLARGGGLHTARREDQADAHGQVVADPDRERLPGWTEPDVGSDRSELETSRRHDPVRLGTTAWGEFAPAIVRWERTLGRPAPRPSVDRRLSPRFVEWMMGLPEGWVTDLPLSRNTMLKMLGNGVVPQQAVHALGMLT